MSKITTRLITGTKHYTITDTSGTVYIILEDTPIMVVMTEKDEPSVSPNDAEGLVDCDGEFWIRNPHNTCKYVLVNSDDDIGELLQHGNIYDGITADDLKDSYGPICPGFMNLTTGEARQ